MKKTTLESVETCITEDSLLVNLSQNISYNTKSKVIISNSNISIVDVVNVARNGYKVEIDSQVKTNIEKSRKVVEDIIDSKKVQYGINTGFGDFANVLISKEDTKKLQHNLIISHACGVGNEFSQEIVRGIMFLRAVSLSKGYSGCRPVVIELLVNMLNSGITPVVYEKGSLGASGDLVPLAHMALVMIGEGEAYLNNQKLSGATALEIANLSPIQLMEKEGLALINGTQAMTSVGTLAVFDAHNLLKCSDIISSISLEALNGIENAFYKSIYKVRPHRGHKVTSENILRLTRDSEHLTKQGEKRVQDPYTLRCIPQIHGASKDAIQYITQVIETEINSVTDNPIIFSDDNSVISAGNFHGQPIALPMDYLAIAVAEIANVSERRIERLVNHTLNDLPAFLVKVGGLNSGFMIPQYAAASLVSENKILAHPASVDSIPSSAGQEDHVSMGTIAARKARDIVKNTTEVLAIEYLASAQALDFREKVRKGKGTDSAYKLLRDNVSQLTEDRYMKIDIDKATKLIQDGTLVAHVENKIGPLEK